jgi:hypothetical protein
MNLASLVNSQDAGVPSQEPEGLASLLSQQSPPSATPAPTHQQAVAGYHRAQQIKHAMGRILQNPKAGHDNIRPLVLEAGADLIGSKILSLSEFMAGISKFPGADDPLGQKKWVQHLIAVNSVAQRKLLQDHRAANPPDYEHGTPWNADDHSDNMAALMSHYPS